MAHVIAIHARDKRGTALMQTKRKAKGQVTNVRGKATKASVCPEAIRHMSRDLASSTTIGHKDKLKIIHRLHKARFDGLIQFLVDNVAAKKPANRWRRHSSTLQ
jgi:hypothetical protein